MISTHNSATGGPAGPPSSRHETTRRELRDRIARTLSRLDRSTLDEVWSTAWREDRS